MGMDTVHPHGCGERYPHGIGLPKNHGSSPRLWGTPVDGEVFIDGLRFIPTAVGNALQGLQLAEGIAVHPHGCGERTIFRSIRFWNAGSSPRLWGTLNGWFLQLTV